MYGQVGSYPDAYEGVCPASPVAYHTLKGGYMVQRTVNDINSYYPGGYVNIFWGSTFAFNGQTYNGGTGTYGITAHLPGVTEVQAGGGIFGDAHYRKNYGVDHEYALTVLTTVLSRPTPTRVVCDAGWKSMARVPMLPEPLGVGEVTSLALSAEHATLELAGASAVPRVGEPVEFVVGYSDATVFLHDELYGTREGQVEVIWPILGRGKTR